MSVKFIHIRPGVRYDAEAKKLVGEPSIKGGLTIAFALCDYAHVGAGSVAHPHVGAGISIALARCHPRDSYSRQKGRLIAGGRLEAGKRDLILPVDKSRGIYEQVVDEVGHYLWLVKSIEKDQQS